MSYILDALKKSDQERKRGDVPNLQTVHIPLTIEPQTSWFLYGFISLLLLLLAFVVGVMFSGKEPADLAYAVEKNDQIKIDSSETPVLAAQPEYTVAQEAKSADGTAGVNLRNKKAAPEKMGYQEPEPQKEVVAEIESKQVRVAAAVEDKAGSGVILPELSNIPYLEEMDDYKQQSIPEMSFAGHVYSTNPTSRSVIINGYAMSEGDTLVEGINVVEITSSGVVFSLHGEFFRMDILQDWSFE